MTTSLYDSHTGDGGPGSAGSCLRLPHTADRTPLRISKRGAWGACVKVTDRATRRHHYCFPTQALHHQLSVLRGREAHVVPEGGARRPPLRAAAVTQQGPHQTGPEAGGGFTFHGSWDKGQGIKCCLAFVYKEQVKKCVPFCTHFMTFIPGVCGFEKKTVIPGFAIYKNTFLDSDTQMILSLWGGCHGRIHQGCHTVCLKYCHCPALNSPQPLLKSSVEFRRFFPAPKTILSGCTRRMAKTATIQAAFRYVTHAEMTVGSRTENAGPQTKK